jgi:hypothetical protein
MNSTMKKVLLSIVFSLAGFAVSTQAQNYRFYNQNGWQTGSARPNYSGGYNFYDQNGWQTGSTRPNYSGGYNFYNQNGWQTGSIRRGW